MVEIKDLKAYVLTNRLNSRLIDNKIPNYPSILPDYTVVHGPVSEDGIVVPPWYKEGIWYDKVTPEVAEIIKNGFCCYLGHSNAIKYHYEKFPDSPLLVLEDDVAFIPNFSVCFNKFIKLVPNDWDAIYIGGHPGKNDEQHYVEVSNNLLLAGHIHGLECTILSPKLIKKLVDYFNDTSEDKYQVDGILAIWSENRIIKAYTPITPFAYQKPSFSTITRTHRDYTNALNFNYTDLNGAIALSTPHSIYKYIIDSVSYDTSNLRVVILTTKGSNRLKDNKPITYPSFLPLPEVFYGVTREDDIEMPTWFNPKLQKKYYNRAVNTWCCLVSKLNLLKDHYNNNPDKDLLFLEDDVEFVQGFESYFSSFMSLVPKDWEMIWFGGAHMCTPIEVVPNVLKPNLMTRSECVLFKSSLIPDAIKVLESGPWKYSRHYSDNIISDLGKTHKFYSPIVPFAYQSNGYSYIRNNYRKFNGIKEFEYMDTSNNLKKSNSDLLENYKDKCDDLTSLIGPTHAYVLVAKNNSRLVDGKIENYPSILPEPDVVYGPTIEDGIVTPSWFINAYEELSKDTINRGYCAFLGHRNAIRNHVEKYPESNLLILEDDVVFEPNFNEYLSTFIKRVPADWDALYLGGRALFSAVESVPDVIKPTGIVGFECTLLRPALAMKLLDYLNDESGAIKIQCDAIINEWCKEGKIKVYMPVFRFAYQKPGFSAHYNKYMDYSRFNYICYRTYNNNIWLSTPNDLARYGTYEPYDNNIKAYVLTTPYNSRLVDGKIENYPSIFPEPDVVYGPTTSTVKSAPGWFVSNRGKTRRIREWCCYSGHLAGLKRHLELYPDKDCLILEDDVAFEPDFNEYFSTFMKMVPKDWDMIYFGGHHYHRPKEIVPNVVRASTIWGLECVLVKASAVPKLVAKLTNTAGETRNAVDVVLNDMATTDGINIYSPIAKFAWQKTCMSIICNKERPSNLHDYSMNHGYIAFNGRVTNSGKRDLNRYKDTSTYEKRCRIEEKSE